MIDRLLQQGIDSVNAIYGDLRDLLVPPSCHLCGMALNDCQIICDPCRLNLTRLNPGQHEICPFCGEKITAKCRCSKGEMGNGLKMFFWGYYEGPLKDAILKFKFHFAVDLGRELTEMAYCALERTMNNRRYNMIIPVPLHKKRIRQRQFNQSEIMALHLSEKLKIPCDMNLLKKSRSTKQQARLSERERWENVRGVFDISGDRGNFVAGKRILLVDDIITTGATALNCALPLSEAGALGIDIFSLAYAK